MESSQSNTNASGSAPSIQPQTEPQSQSQTETETETQSQVHSGTVGGKRKPPKSVVWQHCKKVHKKDDNGIDKVLAVCNYCKLEMPGDSRKNGTPGIRNHLEKRCKLSPLFESGDRTQSILTNVTMGGQAQLVPHTFNQQRCEAKCVRYVIRDEIPFRHVEGGGFKEFVYELNPKFKIPNRKKIAAGVWDLFLVEKAKIMSVIGNHRVSITTDTWTSIQNINYMIVTANFMDNEWNLHKRIINFTKIISHKGIDIGKTLCACLNAWGIVKLFSITVDNAWANDVAVVYVRNRMKDFNNLLLDGKYLHLRCACHILNLIVKDGLKELLSSIEGITNCVKYIHSSLSRLDSFRDHALKMRMDGMTNVPMDVVTRWNSTYKMFDCAFKYKLVFNRMATENVAFQAYFEEIDKDEMKRVGPPSNEDWEKSISFVHFLKKFYDTTLKLSATKTVTSNIIFHELVCLQVEIELKMSDPRDPVLQRVASSMKKKFDKYWGSFESVNKMIFVALVLYPRFKLQMLKISFQNLKAEENKIDEVVCEVRTCLLNLYNEYRGADGLVSQPMNEGEDENVGNDLEGYDDVQTKIFKLLNWWKGNESRYPILSKIAKDIFAIPSSTVASENAFSLGKRIVDPFRGSLTPKMIEALVCTSDWLKADEFCFYKEPTDEELAFYEELEALEANVAGTQTSTTLPPRFDSTSSLPTI
ncbi:unnamed protein product [Prunus armeniaca]